MQAQDQELPTRVGITEAARILGVSKDTIRRRIASGELQAERIFHGSNAPIRIRLDELERHARPIPTVGNIGGAA